MSTTLTQYRGEHVVWQLAATENGVVVDLTGATVVFAVRAAYPAETVVSDVDAVFTKTNVGAGGLVLTDPDGGLFEVEILHADTDGLALRNGQATYRWGCEYIPGGETEPRTLDQGDYVIESDIVRSI